MLIRLGYDICFRVTSSVPIITMLNVHPSRENDLVEPDLLNVFPEVPVVEFRDVFGNRCCRFVAPEGELRLSNSTLIRDSGEPDKQDFYAREVPVQELPAEALPYLMNSRYCEVDLLSPIAAGIFGGVPRGYGRVQAICDWIHDKLAFGYPFARPTRTALNAYTEQIGVCRDFQHLAVTFCRALNIPARYATGYLGDIGIPASPSPMDFSAWFQAYLEDRWWTFDARHNTPRIGRVLIAVGRDATDVAITTSFGDAQLLNFQVTTNEVPESEDALPVATNASLTFADAEG
jgi:transglutaminase-like putative cysteine protease